MTTIRQFSGREEGCDLKEATVGRFNNENLELKRNLKRHCEDIEIAELPAKKRGHPLLSGE